MHNRYSKKPAGKKFKSDYTPSIRDAAEDFLSSLINIPIKYNKVDFEGKEVTLTKAVYSLLGLEKISSSGEDFVIDFFSTVYPNGDQKTLERIDYALKAFERFQEYKKNPEYKKVNLEFIDIVRSSILGG